MIDQHTLKEKTQTFLKPFQPLGQAIAVFAKTTTGKTVGWVIIVIIVICSVSNILRSDRMTDNHFFDYKDDRHTDPRARHDRQMRIFDAEMRATQDRIAKHRAAIQQLFTMDAKDLSAQTTQDPQKVNQTISKVRIVNDEQFGYTLTISGWVLNGKLNGDNLTGVIARLQSADITLADNTFSIPYSLDTLEKVVNILDNKEQFPSETHHSVIFS